MKWSLFQWERRKHHDCGGIANGQYWLGYDFETELKMGGYYPRRYLINSMSPSTRTFQSEVDSPGDKDQLQSKIILDSAGNVISLGLLPVTALNCQGICSSVFTKSKWIRRKLSINELGEVFDQPLEVIDSCSEKNLDLRIYHSHQEYQTRSFNGVYDD